MIWNDSSTESLCTPSDPTKICVYVPKPDGSGSELVPFPNGGSAGNKIYDNLVYSVR